MYSFLGLPPADGSSLKNLAKMTDEPGSQEIPSAKQAYRGTRKHALMSLISRPPDIQRPDYLPREDLFIR